MNTTLIFKILFSSFKERFQDFNKVPHVLDFCNYPFNSDVTKEEFVI